MEADGVAAVPPVPLHPPHPVLAHIPAGLQGAIPLSMRAKQITDWNSGASSPSIFPWYRSHSCTSAIHSATFCF